MESHKIHVPNHQPVFDFASKIWLELESPFCLVNSLKSEADHSWGTPHGFPTIFLWERNITPRIHQIPSNPFKSHQSPIKSIKTYLKMLSIRIAMKILPICRSFRFFPSRQQHLPSTQGGVAHHVVQRLTLGQGHQIGCSLTSPEKLWNKRKPMVLSRSSP